MVVAKKGNTGDQILSLCERRLDNVIRRAGFTKTRPQARQGIVHGHFYVNGIKVTSPSYQLRPGDVITIRPKEAIFNLYKSVVGDGNNQQTPDWITFDTQTLRATMVGLPGPGESSLPVDVNIVVEFLAR
jgi:small subunit ribosomal protein S4